MVSLYILLFVGFCVDIARSVGNGIDPDQRLCSTVSDLGLHWLLRPVCLNS